MKFLTEDKSNLIKRLVKRGNLSPEQGEEIIKYFQNNPGKDSLIDWNNINLKYEDFLVVMTNITKTSKEKLVMNKGISGLTEGQDYIVVFEGYNPFGQLIVEMRGTKKNKVITEFGLDNPDSIESYDGNEDEDEDEDEDKGEYSYIPLREYLKSIGEDNNKYYDQCIVEGIPPEFINESKPYIMGYVPLTWEASKHIASHYVGPDRITGEWCTAYQKDRSFWDKYNRCSFLIYFVNYSEVSNIENLVPPGHYRYERGYQRFQSPKIDWGTDIDWGKNVLQLFKGDSEDINDYNDPDFFQDKDQYTYRNYYKTWTSQDDSSGSFLESCFNLKLLDADDIAIEAIRKIRDAGGIERKQSYLEYEYKLNFIPPQQNEIIGIEHCGKFTKKERFINQKFSKKGNSTSDIEQNEFYGDFQFQIYLISVHSGSFSDNIRNAFSQDFIEKAKYGLYIKSGSDNPQYLLDNLPEGTLSNIKLVNKGGKKYKVYSDMNMYSDTGLTGLLKELVSNRPIEYIIMNKIDLEETGFEWMEKLFPFMGKEVIIEADSGKSDLIAYVLPEVLNRENNIVSTYDQRKRDRQLDLSFDL